MKEGEGFKKVEDVETEKVDIEEARRKILDFRPVIFGTCKAMLDASKVSEKVVSAEDMAQEATMAALRDAPKLTSLEDIRGWVMVVARNAVKMKLRAEKSRGGLQPPEESDFALPRLEDSRVNLEEKVLAKVEVQRLMPMLTKRQRQMVRLHYFMGLKLVEIAQLLGVDKGTVGTTIKNAEAKMRSILKSG